MMTWTGYGISERGNVRATNQDAFCMDNRLKVWAVADGMGGHVGGDIASRLVIDTIVQRLTECHASLSSVPDGADRVLMDMVEDANNAVLDHARRNPELTGMGTTLALMHISDGPSPIATVLHEGDSRAYLFRDGQLIQLTQDHSLVEQYIEQGLLTPEQALHHPQRHILCRAMGLGSHAQADIATRPLQEEDLLILCTDGLTKMVDDAHLIALLRNHPRHAEQVCSTLIAAAIDAGGVDNVTVVACAKQE
ncbi:MAG: Stp1/IreP family PP2C-type Ser/Thr phosphatase [Nitrospiraceae bacterium]